MSRILAIDYGLKRVGIAVTDPLQIIAKPLVVIKCLDVIDWLQDYVKKEPVEAIVVGMPLRLNGQETHITQDVLQFIIVLKNTFQTITIDTMDERLTSKMARQSMIDSGMPYQKRKAKGNLDSISASLILQSYLEKIK